LKQTLKTPFNIPVDPLPQTRLLAMRYLFVAIVLVFAFFQVEAAPGGAGGWPGGHDWKRKETSHLEKLDTE
jgi:hypothetical protein